MIDGQLPTREEFWLQLRAITRATSDTSSNAELAQLFRRLCGRARRFGYVPNIALGGRIFHGVLHLEG